MTYRIIEAIVSRGWVIAKEPGRILHRKFEDYRGGGNTWEIFVNGNSRMVEIKAAQWGELELPSFHMAIFWNGWLAGMMTFSSGQIAAGEGANEDSLIESILRVPVEKIR